MKLAESTTSLVCSQKFEETEFGIGDPILIMEYLRKNAYSNPKRAICQEIMCNARDAHREVGSTDAVIIKLPTRMNPVWSCRDFGPGINPKRMADVFTKFGKSTKRTDNTQTGGFGIGAKTPWAYTDTFLIDTVCEIEGHFIKFQYAAVIGANRVPKLVQMGDPTFTTEKRSGTTISFNVEAKDQSDFARYTYEVSRYWDVRPEVSGTDEYKSIWNIGAYKYKQDAWAISDVRGDSSKVVIDGIPYALNVESLGDKINESERDMLRYNTCVLFFGVGELSVSLNREALYYDERTIKLILDSVRSMIEYLRVHHETVVANSKTLWDAAIALKVACGFFHNCSGFLKGIKWNDKLIPTEIIYGGNAVDVIHYERSAPDSYKYGGKVRRFTSHSSISFNDNAKLIEGDSRTKIEYLFSQDKSLKHVYVFRKRHTGADPVWDKWLTDTRIMDLDPIKIESLPIAPRVPRVKSAYVPHQRVKTYVWSGYDWNDTELDSDVLKNGKGVYVPCFRRRACTDNTCAHEFDGNYTKVSDMLKIIRNTKLVVHGIQKDLIPSLGAGWITLFDYLRNLITEAATEYKVEVSDISNFISKDYNLRTDYEAAFHKIIVANLANMPECIVNWHGASETLNKLKSDNTFPFNSCSCSNNVGELIGIPKMFKKAKSLENLKEKVYNECKLLKTICFSRYGYEAPMDEHVVIYLAAIKVLEEAKALVA